MKRIALITTLIIASFTSAGQEIQHEAVAINIEVPVRVFKGATFIDNLTLDDFEVYEDGVLHSVEAVYLIKKTTIEREERPKEEEKPKEVVKTFKPQVKSRHFILAYETINWVPRIGESVDYFFSNVFQPSDTLVLVTPVKSYNLSKRAIESMPKDKICAQFKSILRKEIIGGNREYKEIIRDYKRYEELKRYGQFDYDAIVLMQRALFFKLRDYKYFDESKLSVFTDYLKDLEGQKHIFLFYQKEELPYPEEIMSYGELMEMGFDFDVDQIKNYFSDSTITVHFIFLTNKAEETIDVENRENLQIPLSDQSFQVFSAFNEVAKTTGGLTYASGNPFAAFKRAADASENYYLLYYTPKDYKSDGKFHNIKVKIKGKKYRVLHRAGYLAD